MLEGTKYENMGTILNDNVLFCHPYEHFQEGMPKDYVPPPKIDNATAVKEMIRLGRTMPLVTLLGTLGWRGEQERWLENCVSVKRLSVGFVFLVFVSVYLSV